MSPSLKDTGKLSEDWRVALKNVEQQPFAERLKGLKLFSLQLRRLTGRSMVEVYKVMEVVGKVSVYLHSVNVIPPETGTLMKFVGD